MQTESALQTSILNWLKLNKHYAVKVVVASKAGTPDILACVNGHFVAFECKSAKGVLSPLQRYTIDQIRKSNGTAFEVNSLTQVVSVVSSLLRVKQHGNG